MKEFLKGVGYIFTYVLSYIVATALTGAFIWWIVNDSLKWNFHESWDVAIVVFVGAASWDTFTSIWDHIIDKIKDKKRRESLKEYIRYKG
jgi:hypothetical protein